MQDWIVILIVAGAVAYAGATVWRTLAGRGGCACANKGHCAKAGPIKSPSNLGKIVPLVTLERRPTSHSSR